MKTVIARLHDLISPETVAAAHAAAIRLNMKHYEAADTRKKLALIDSLARKVRGDGDYELYKAQVWGICTTDPALHKAADRSDSEIGKFLAAYMQFVRAIVG